MPICKNLFNVVSHKEFPIMPISIPEDFTNFIPSDNTPVLFNNYF